MARFDVYNLAQNRGFVVDCQSDLTDEFGTRVVIPLISDNAKPVAVRRLHPKISFEGADYVLATHLLLAMPTKALGQPVGSLAARQEEIAAALDMLFVGF